MLLYLFCNKSHYENVPFEIPKNWVWCKLDDLAFYKKGPFGSSLTKSMFIPDNGNAYKVYEQKNAIQKDSHLGHYFISSEKFQELKGFEVLPNDIIVSCAGTIGETYIMPSDIRSGIINQALMIIRLHNIDITPFYLLYFDFILKNEAGKDGKGTAIKNIPPFDILKNYWIPLPPLAEQDRIIKEVALWQCLIDSIDGNIEDIFKLSKKTKSKILDLAISGKLVPQDPNDEPAIELLKRINPGFEPCDNSHYENLPENWCLAKVKDVFVINPRNKAEDNTIAGFIPMTLIDDGYSNTFSYEKRKWGAIKTGFTHFADGDVAVAKISPCLENRKSIVLRDLPNGIGAGTTELHVFRSSVVSPEYALYFFKSEYFISRCVGTFNGVVGQQRVGKNIIEEIQIPIPPINEQTKIVSTIETIFTQLNTITAEL